jgi:hypothetical protein
MDGVFVIFAVIAEARFCTKKGEDQIALKAKRKFGPGVWDGPRVQGACHHVQRGVNGLPALLGGQTVYMTIQKTGLFVEALSIFCLMYFSFLLTAIRPRACSRS